MAVDFTGGAGRRAFGHGGMASSRGLADPEADLVMVFVCNGLPDPIAAERRSAEVTDAVYTALGDRCRALPAAASGPSERWRSLRSRGRGGDELEDALVHRRRARHDVAGGSQAVRRPASR